MIPATGMKFCEIILSYFFFFGALHFRGTRERACTYIVKIMREISLKASPPNGCSHPGHPEAHPGHPEPYLRLFQPFSGCNNVDLISDASISAERMRSKTRFLKLCLRSKSFSSPLFDIILPTIRAISSRGAIRHTEFALTNAKVPAGIHEENQDRRISTSS